jgi:hypothetical protein
LKGEGARGAPAAGAELPSAVLEVRRRQVWRTEPARVRQRRYDPHLRATVLHGELVEAGFERSYPTLVRKLRRLELRPVCLVCQRRGGRAPTVELEHPAGEEIQWD